jgi:hypothetical protein
VGVENGHKPDENEVLINGKRVVLRARVPLSRAPELPKMLAAVETDLRAVARVGAVLIEEWEFDGAPSDRRSYEDLDITTEILPLAVALGQYINRRLDWSGGKA